MLLKEKCRQNNTIEDSISETLTELVLYPSLDCSGKGMVIIMDPQDLSKRKNNRTQHIF